MQHTLKNVVSVILSLFRFVLLKLFYRGRFRFYFIERFSPGAIVELYGGGRIHLGKKVRAHSGVRIRAIKRGKVIIGDNVSLNYGCMLFSMQEIHIERGVEFGPNVLVYDHDHDYKKMGGLKAGKFLSDDVFIGENTWVGANTIILRGSRIGANCVIAANCVIKGLIPDNTIVYQERINTIRPIVRVD